MKKVLIILLAAAVTACNPGQKTDGTSDVSGSSDTLITGAGGSDSLTPESEDPSITSIDTSVSNFITLAVMGNALEVEASEVAQKKSKNPDVQAFAGTMVTDHGKALDKLHAVARKKKIELPMVVDAFRNWGTAEQSATKTTSDAAEKYGSQSRPGNDVVTYDKGGATGSGKASSSNATQSGSKSQNTALANSMYAGHQEKLNRLKQRTGADFDREYGKMMVNDHAKAMNLLKKGLQNKDEDIRAFSQEMLPTIKTHEASTKMLMNKIQSQK